MARKFPPHSDDLASFMFTGQCPMENGAKLILDTLPGDRRVSDDMGRAAWSCGQGRSSPTVPL